jgi:hypothetical protein
MKTLIHKSFYFAALISLMQPSAALSQNKPIVRLTMNSIGSSDETVFYFEQGGTTDFQSDFDAYKLLSGPNTPYIGSMSDSVLTSISGLPALPVNLSIPVKAISPTTRGFVFKAEKTDFPDNVCVTLYDAFTGRTINILETGGYECTLYDTTTTVRFTMNFFTTSLNATSLVKQADCQSSGMISVSGADNGPWNYEWSIGDSIVKVSKNQNSADSLVNLGGGHYTVKISSVGQCASFSKTFTIDSVNASKADFTADVYVTTLSNAGAVNFSNQSANAMFNIWDFGDKSGTYYMPAPSHNYKAAGFYTVTLISESSSHCKDTATQVIQVVDDATGISELNQNGKLTLATLVKGEYELLINLEQVSDLTLVLMDLNGNLIKTRELSQVLSTKEKVALTDLSSGLYLLKVTDKKQERIFKLIH